MVVWKPNGIDQSAKCGRRVDEMFGAAEILPQMDDEMFGAAEILPQMEQIWGSKCPECPK